MNTAAVIIIGNEILSGRTRDANLAFLGSRLANLGINLLEARIIPDDEQTIIDSVNSCREQFDYVFTTGGIGPTHDDITSASIAKAFNVPLEKNGDALLCLERYYGKPEVITTARMKMACIPVNSVLIYNPVSGAPGFQIGNVFVLPGIPEVLQAMFDGITDRLTGGAPILNRSISTDLREGDLADGLGKIQDRFPAVAIGSYPTFKGSKPGVNLVMRSTEATVLDQVYTEVEGLLQQLGGRAEEVV